MMYKKFVLAEIELNKSQGVTKEKNIASSSKSGNKHEMQNCQKSYEGCKKI